MVAVSATTIIYGALRLSKDGLKRPGRTASTEELADGLLRLNELVDAWGTNGLTKSFLLRTIVPLVAGQASYTIGTGGDVSIVQPTEITYVNLLWP